MPTTSQDQENETSYGESLEEDAPHTIAPMETFELKSTFNNKIARAMSFIRNDNLIFNLEHRFYTVIDEYKKPNQVKININNFI